MQFSVATDQKIIFKVKICMFITGYGVMLHHMSSNFIRYACLLLNLRPHISTCKHCPAGIQTLPTPHADISSSSVVLTPWYVVCTKNTKALLSAQPGTITYYASQAASCVNTCNDLHTQALSGCMQGVCGSKHYCFHITGMFSHIVF